jgi:hypothetical protein
MKTLRRFLLLVLGLAFVGALAQKPDNSPRVIETGAIPSPPPPPDPRRTALGHISIKNFNWTKGGFGTVMILNELTISNGSKYSAQDFQIECTVSAPSGTLLGRPSTTLYETVGAGKTRSFRDLSVGFVHSQATQASCRISGVTVGGQAFARL